jgi:hypothetical protein
MKVKFLIALFFIGTFFYMVCFFRLGAEEDPDSVGDRFGNFYLWQVMVVFMVS